MKHFNLPQTPLSKVLVYLENRKSFSKRERKQIRKQLFEKVIPSEHI